MIVGGWMLKTCEAFALSIGTPGRNCGRAAPGRESAVPGAVRAFGVDGARIRREPGPCPAGVPAAPAETRRRKKNGSGVERRFRQRR